jgi:hypothetical protein
LFSLFPLHEINEQNKKPNQNNSNNKKYPVWKKGEEPPYFKAPVLSISFLQSHKQKLLQIVISGLLCLYFPLIQIQFGAEISQYPAWLHFWAPDLLSNGLLLASIWPSH